MDKRIIDNLIGIMDNRRVFTQKEDLICYSFDGTNQSLLPEAVVFPQNSDEISKILILANENKISVIPRGAGTGYSGGAVPPKGGGGLVLYKIEKIF